MRTWSILIALCSCISALAQDTVLLDPAYYPNKRLEATSRIDTAGLEHFWGTFQDNLRRDQRSEVVQRLDFPIHEILVAQWNFSVSCDTAAYVRDEHKYLDADITRENGMTRFEFLFTEALRSMIARTDVDRILEEGVVGPGGITYRFFAKDYGKGCGSDLALHFYFHRSPAGWRLSIASV